MIELGRRANSRSPGVGLLVGIGGRASGLALRPVTGAVGGAVRIGVRVERRAVDRVLDSGELERILIAGLDSALVQDAFRRALASEGAGRLVDSFFESGLFDHFIARFRASDALWRLVNRIAQSPSVLVALPSRVSGSPIRPAERSGIAHARPITWLSGPPVGGPIRTTTRSRETRTQQRDDQRGRPDGRPRADPGHTPRERIIPCRRQ